MSWVNGSLESSWAYSKISLRGRSRSSATHLMGLGIIANSAIISSSRQKRKRDERLNGGNRLKRSKSNGSYTSMTNVRIEEGELNAISTYSIQEIIVDGLVDY